MKSLKIVLDTETCPLDNSLNTVVPSNMFVYDIGWAVVDKDGNVYKTCSFVNSDIYSVEKELMKSGYYASKLPQYARDIENGTRILATFYEIRKALLEDIEAFNVKEIFAHNMRFDYGALNNTQRWLTKSKYRFYFPKSINICDTLKMARDVVAKTPSYKKFCESNGYLTKNGRAQLKAETLYKFITKDLDFVESHTALEDVLIEKEIMAYCYRKHKKMRKLLWDRG